MNPIFQEAVRRVLHRQRKRLDSSGTNKVYFPSEKDLSPQARNALAGLPRLNLFWFGLIGALLTIFCAFTPLPILFLSVVGLNWLVVYLNYSLFTVVLVLLGIAFYAWWRNHI